MVLQVYAVQTTEIRQFTLQPRLCWPPSVGDSQQQDALPTSAAIGSAENPSTLHDVFGKLALQVRPSSSKDQSQYIIFRPGGASLRTAQTFARVMRGGAGVVAALIFGQQSLLKDTHGQPLFLLFPARVDYCACNPLQLYSDT